MENDADYWRSEAEKLDPNWDQAIGRIHDWRNYVGTNVRRLWPTLAFRVRHAIVLDANDMAMDEEHD